ncbi:MAG: glycosyltransferase family 4 protein [Clostridiales bacterium]|nr:glycosyltransferase family 4 protein [Clostridiales bacterium]
MKICFFIYSMGFGGAERTVSYLANYGIDNGVDVDVAIIDKNTNTYKLDDKVKVHNIGFGLNVQKRHKTIFGKVYGVINSILKIKRNFARYLKENKPDAVFCMSETVVKYVPKNTRAKIFGTERSNPSWIKSKSKLKQRIKAYNRCDAMVFQTKRAMQYYEGKIFVKNQVVIPNAIGNELCYKVVYDAKSLEKKICAVGSLRAQKDYPTLLKAFEIVLKKHSDFKLEIFGEGYDKDNLKALSEKLKISKNIDFKGNDLEALKKISNAYCYVMSSISEGMPNALMEAMAIGMPCVSTDCNNGPAELIENEKNGLLVPIQNPEVLAGALCKMIENRKFAEGCGKEATKILKTNSIEEISKRYFEFINSIIKDKK